MIKFSCLNDSLIKILNDKKSIDCSYLQVKKV